MPTGQAPLVRTLVHDAEPQAAGAGASEVIGRVPFTGAVTAVRYIPLADINGVNTNTRLIEVYRRPAAGGAAVRVASLQFNAGTNAPGFQSRALTLDAAANLAVAEGDVLEFRSSPVGTGLADPGGTVEVDVSRD